MKLLDVIIETALSSSQAFNNLAKEVALINEELKSIRDSLISIVRAVQIQQIAIDELLNNEAPSKKFDISLGGKNNEKKEKPN